MDGVYESYKSPPDSGNRVDANRGRDDDPFPTRPVDSYRRRSPASQDRRHGAGGRRRSRSPVAIDRYQPSDRAPRDDFYNASREYASRDREERRRAPSPVAANIDRYVPGQEPAKSQVRVNPLPNPLTLDYQVGFNFFAEWWRTEQAIKEEKERAKHGGRRPSDRVKGEKEAREEREKERAQIQVAYDAYKAELQVKMARSFVQQHKGEEWFRERYLPEVRDPIRRKLMDFRRSAYEQWESDLEAGTFDEFTLEGIYKNESDGAGGIIEKEEGETTAVGEVLSVLDLLPAKGGDLRDESINQPALLIKTLAPNVSRDKIEDFCKEHLGEEESGFKWLSLSDPNPLKKCHRIGWIMLHPGPEPMAEIERGDGRDEEGEETETGAGMNGHGGNSTSERALEAINEKTIKDEVRGDFVCHVGVHVPPSMPRKKALWDLFSAPERVARDLELARRLVAKLDGESAQDVDAFAKIEDRVEDLRGKGWLQPAVTAPAKAKKSIDPDADMVLLDDEAEEGEEEEGAYDDEEEVDDEDILVQKKKLDLAVEYLRRVYNFCFFCVFESDSIHELTRKCPGGHLRRPRAGLSSAAKAAAKASALGEPFPIKKKETSDDVDDGVSPVDEKKPRFNKNDQQLLRAFNWVKTFEDKLLQLLEPENVDLKKLGGKPEDEALDEELAKFVKQEDESKFRCKVPECTKLFKAQHFWKKHVEKRHEEWLESIGKDLSLVNTYVLDPAHIAPSRSDANSNGHFPLPNNHNMPTGTPRGFNLQQMQQFGPFNPFMPGMTGMQPNGMGGPGYPGFMTNHSVQAPPGGWPNGLPGPEANGMMGMHHPGVMRRGGNRYNGNRSGPYDRRGNNQRNDARGGAMGMGMGMSINISGPPGRMMSGPVGSGMGTGVTGNRWGDGLGGGAMMGPREAVQGRQLKSYEDLDTPRGGGDGELNY